MNDGDVTLLSRQQDFARFVGLLLAHIYEQGWAVTFGDASRMDMQGHMKNSCHYIRLAVDLNLFVNGVYQQADGSEFQDLGSFWKTLDPDCRWGGDFKGVEADPNHFSITWQGRS